MVCKRTEAFISVIRYKRYWAYFTLECFDNLCHNVLELCLNVQFKRLREDSVDVLTDVLNALELKDIVNLFSRHKEIVEREQKKAGG